MSFIQHTTPAQLNSQACQYEAMRLNIDRTKENSLNPVSYRVMHTVIPPRAPSTLEKKNFLSKVKSFQRKFDCWNRDSIDASISLNARLRIFDSHYSSRWEYAAHRCCDRACSGGISQVAFSSLLINVIIGLGDNHTTLSLERVRTNQESSTLLASTQKLFSHNSCSSRRRRLQLERVDLEKVVHHTRDSVLE